MQRTSLAPDLEPPVVKEEAEDFDDDDGVDPKILQDDIEEWEKCNRIGVKTPIRIKVQRRLGKYVLAEDHLLRQHDE